MLTRTFFLNASLLALFCVSTAVISGCSSPDGSDAPFAPAGEWGLVYAPSFEMATSYSNAANQTVNPPISALVPASDLVDAGAGYNQIVVFLYDPTAHTVTVGEPNPATDGGGPEVPNNPVFTLDSSNQVSVDIGTNPTFTAIASTSCGVSTNETETIQFSADGSSLVITEALAMSVIANNSGTGMTCVQYLTQEQGKVQASVTTDISNYVQDFSTFLSTGAINVADMPSLTAFSLNATVNGTRVNTSIDVPQADQARPGSAPAAVKFQVTVTDARIGKMLQDLITRGVQK